LEEKNLLLSAPTIIFSFSRTTFHLSSFKLPFHHTHPQEAMNVHDSFEHDESYAAMCQRTDAMLNAAAHAACSTFNNAPDNYEEVVDVSAEVEEQTFVKLETPTEKWKRILLHREAKSVASVKTAAKKSVKKRMTKKISAHFARKETFMHPI